MSLRIAPPTARVLPVYDDGDLRPLVAKLDEYYALAPIVPLAAPTRQPSIDDGDLPAPRSAAGAPSGSRGAVIIRIRVGSYAQPLGDDGDLSFFIATPIRDEDPAPALISLARPFTAQPIADDDLLSVLIALDEAEGMEVILDPPAHAAQPLGDDGDLPRSVPFTIIDEDPFLVLNPVDLRVLAQPYAEDPFPLGTVAPVVDEDGQLICYAVIGTYAAQPICDDLVELGGIVTLPITDDDGQIIGYAPTSILAAQPFGDDGDLAVAGRRVFYRGEVIELLPCDARIVLKRRKPH